eukprot:comp24170_c0_seq1/m.44094 comp24170_c0_seq1/g.44094  ORF comp24170_c0_seq1/g.44094 comp24170_c0_seq1/m.44094 type:complete len:520 (+) comp24170_c0_seq1:626-2185(+)
MVGLFYSPPLGIPVVVHLWRLCLSCWLLFVPVPPIALISIGRAAAIRIHPGGPTWRSAAGTVIAMWGQLSPVLVWGGATVLPAGLVAAVWVPAGCPVLGGWAVVCAGCGPVAVLLLPVWLLLGGAWPPLTGLAAWRLCTIGCGGCRAADGLAARWRWDVALEDVVAGHGAVLLEVGQQALGRGLDQLLVLQRADLGVHAAGHALVEREVLGNLLEHQQGVAHHIALLGLQAGADVGIKDLVVPQAEQAHIVAVAGLHRAHCVLLDQPLRHHTARCARHLRIVQGLAGVPASCHAQHGPQEPPVALCLRVSEVDQAGPHISEELVEEAHGAEARGAQGMHGAHKLSRIGAVQRAEHAPWAHTQLHKRTGRLHGPPVLDDAVCEPRGGLLPQAAHDSLLVLLVLHHLCLECIVCGLGLPLLAPTILVLSQRIQLGLEPLQPGLVALLGAVQVVHGQGPARREQPWRDQVPLAGPHGHQVCDGAHDVGHGLRICLRLHGGPLCIRAQHYVSLLYFAGKHGPG